jgi:BirA family biotin operon repressor/biotin-[acetyl-CoA-carboxylase] ligase
LTGGLAGAQLFFFDKLDSTMNRASKLAEDGYPDGTVVVAGQQTSAKGRLGRSWISPPGQNIYLSVIVRPTLSQLRYVNMAGTLAVCRTISDISDLSPSIKWPNDVKVNGRKISGVLLESVIEMGMLKHAVLGIGMNVSLDPSEIPEISSIATSLSVELGAYFEKTAVLKILIERLDQFYNLVKRGCSITEEWVSQMETIGKTIQVRIGNQLLEGKARCVDNEGNLVLEKPDGSVLTLIAGEITLQS